MLSTCRERALPGDRGRTLSSLSGTWESGSELTVLVSFWQEGTRWSQQGILKSPVDPGPVNRAIAKANRQTGERESGSLR